MRIKSATALIAAAGLLASVGTALAADPTQADFDACNKEAQGRLSSPAASPSTTGGASGSVSGSTSKDHPSASTPSTSGGTSGSVSGGASGTTGSGSVSGGTSGSMAGGRSGSTSGGSVSGGASTSTDADVALRGIDAMGKSDPAFQAAYRDCMKRRGF